MQIVFRLSLFLALLFSACGGSAPTPTSLPDGAPTFVGAQTPRLLLQSPYNPGRVVSIDLTTGLIARDEFIRTSSLADVLTAEYRLVGNALLGREGRFFVLTGGAIAPTGLWLATQRSHGLALVRNDAGQEQALSSSGRAPVWSPDGRWLAYQDDQGLWVVAPETPTPQQLLAASAEPLAWSPDNRQILLRQGDKASILEVENGRQTTLAIDAAQLRPPVIWSPAGQRIYARFGDNGQLTSTSAFLQNDDTLSRLVAIDSTATERANLADLAPNRRNQGVLDFLVSPGGEVIAARFFRCSLRFGGIVPFIPGWGCQEELLLIESATGRTLTLPANYEAIAMAWDVPQLAVVHLESPPPTASVQPAPDAIPQLIAAGVDDFWQPTAAPGRNPATALAPGKVGAGRSILAVVVGDEAATLAQTADPSYLPPAPGYQYVAVRQRQTTDESGATMFQSPRSLLLDDRRAGRPETLWLNGEGRTITELRYSAAAPAEFWQVFVIDAEAQPWLLVAPAFNTDDPDLYFRLDDAPANAPPPTTAAALTANTAGVGSPAGPGETTVSAEWQVGVIATNDVAEHPALNRNLVKLRMAYTGAAPAVDRLLTCVRLAALSGMDGTRIAASASLGQLPLAMLTREVCFLPGGVYSGWLLILPPPDSTRAVFRFTPPRPTPFGERLFAVEIR